jgi:hypothetical protein
MSEELIAEENRKRKGMKKEREMKRILGVVFGLLLLASCASMGKDATGDVAPTKAGFLEGYYENLCPGPEEGAKMRWLKPGVDFGQYDRVMVDSVIFYLSDESEHKGIDGNEMKELTDTFNQEIVSALKDKYPIVSEPGPDVLRIRIAITEIKQSNPGLSTVTSVIPIGLGVSLVKKGATGSYTGSGETGVEVMVLDSMTNEVIGAAQDERTAGFSERFSKWGSAKEEFKFWAERLVFFMESARSGK